MVILCYAQLGMASIWESCVYPSSWAETAPRMREVPGGALAPPNWGAPTPRMRVVPWGDPALPSCSKL